MANAQQNKVIDALLERLYAALLRGPALNANPVRSRQRIDLSLVERLGDAGTAALADLLGPDKAHRLSLNIPTVPKQVREDETADERRLRRELEEATRLVNRIATIIRDADMHQRDTGSPCLFIGYPLLSIPEPPRQRKGAVGRVLAPVAFLPVTLELTQGSRPSLRIVSSASSGIDRVIPNLALKTMVERETGTGFGEVFEDDEGQDPQRELSELIAHLATTLGITEVPSLEGWPIVPVPETEELPATPAIIPGAVLGLFPLAKQGAIRDLEELRDMAELPASVRAFVTLDAALIARTDDAYADTDDVGIPLLPAAEEHLVESADPCQRRAVIRARSTRGLVVHGPPGTGKSQTITNIIGDYLARSKRVLLVCEKRTALDVVRHRLDGRGLGHLCAVVHDATADRTALYTGIREQIDALADSPELADPKTELARVNRETDALFDELRDFFGRVAEKDADSAVSFHELMGFWFASAGNAAFEPVEVDPELGFVPLESVRQNEGILRAAYRRLLDADLAENAWDERCAISLDQFLTRRMDDFRRALDAAITAARATSQKIVTGIPVSVTDLELAGQARWRDEVGTQLAHMGISGSKPLLAAAAEMSRPAINEALNSAAGLAGFRKLLASTPLPADLEQAYSIAPMSPQQVPTSILALAEYLAKAQGLFGFFQFGIRKAAAAVLAPFALPLTAPNAERIRAYLERVHARNLIRAWFAARVPVSVQPSAVETELLRQFDDLCAVLMMIVRVEDEPQGAGLAALFRGGLARDPMGFGNLMRQSSEHLHSVIETLRALIAIGLLTPGSIALYRVKMQSGQAIETDLEKLLRDLPKLEQLLRFADETSSFPPAVATTLRGFGLRRMEDEQAWRQLVAGVCSGLIERRIGAAGILARCDSARIEGNFRRLRELTLRKAQLESERIRHLWQQHQRSRLLASTGSRLNTNGADLRRRLMLRGKQASRIRQVIHEGRKLAEGDPLFDIHPVWMTSPETASLIFPAEKLFDVVIFDEASQCRLEEGLPVLLRGENIVIAGDTRQLPPTRFFETAIVSSEGVEEVEGGQEELFQSQQKDIEDLLSAALNIEVEQSYLDVHYRSAHEELIRFSNDSFYGSRLQAIPSHPNSTAGASPILLHPIGGIYEKRMNPAEAEFVVDRVRVLLALPEPPSIGIVSFNIAQKDLIEDALDRAATADFAFRGRLEAARNRERNGAYEGLFVKNLENVQGDERDVIIISTTYGPNTEGRFFRRFGPLATAGGERRLNVLVTRARLRVELATSIPEDVYRSISSENPPAGKRPTGSWYLMRYLADAQDLTEQYASTAEEQSRRSEEGPEEPHIERVETATPSRFVETFAQILRDRHGVSSLLYAGNDGFQVDLAFRHPSRSDEVTIGVLFDGTRYPRAQDRVEWDGFRRGVLGGRRWELHTVTTAQFRRDPEGCVKRLLDAAASYVAEDRWLRS